MKKSISLVLAAIPVACASTPPTPIGNDTYYLQKSSADAAYLMQRANSFCDEKGREFLLVSQAVKSSGTSSPVGGATITFQCVELSTSTLMYPEKSLPTVNNR
jgi:hypothetical protein